MAKIYYLRHQAHGVVYDFPFAEPPSEQQHAAVERFCFQKHGGMHSKGSPYWMRLVEVNLLGAGDVPDVPERDLKQLNMGQGLVGDGIRGDGGAETNYKAFGTGSVTNPEAS